MFRIDVVPGKGVGWIATRRIEPLIEINNEAPLFVASKTSSDAEIDALVDLLSAENRAAFDALVGDTNGEKFFRNGLGVASDALGSKHPRAGVFKNNSRINHSCSPNAVSACDHLTGELCVLSGSDAIEAGDEITITYLTGSQNLLAYDARRAVLSAGVSGFECDCSRCSLSSRQRKVSDGRRVKIGQLIRALLSMPGGSAEYFQTFAKLQQVCKQEGVPLHVAAGGAILGIFSKLQMADTIPDEHVQSGLRPARVLNETVQHGSTVHSPDTPRCEVCGTHDQLLRCGKCKSVYYCGRTHQRKHWKAHKMACKGNV